MTAKMYNYVTSNFSQLTHLVKLTQQLILNNIRGSWDSVILYFRFIALTFILFNIILLLTSRYTKCQNKYVRSVVNLIVFVHSISDFEKKKANSHRKDTTLYFRYLNLPYD